MEGAQEYGVGVNQRVKVCKCTRKYNTRRPQIMESGCVLHADCVHMLLWAITIVFLTSKVTIMHATCSESLV